MKSFKKVSVLALGFGLLTMACGLDADRSDDADNESGDVPSVETASAAPKATSISGHICGDINGSGTVTVTDATLAGSFASGALKPTDWQFWSADVDSDRRITANDQLLIQRKAAGISVTLNCSTFGPLTK